MRRWQRRRPVHRRMLQRRAVGWRRQQWQRVRVHQYEQRHAAAQAQQQAVAARQRRRGKYRGRGSAQRVRARQQARQRGRQRPRRPALPPAHTALFPRASAPPAARCRGVGAGRCASSYRRWPRAARRHLAPQVRDLAAQPCVMQLHVGEKQLPVTPLLVGARAAGRTAAGLAQQVLAQAQREDRADRGMVHDLDQLRRAGRRAGVQEVGQPRDGLQVNGRRGRRRVAVAAVVAALARVPQAVDALLEGGGLLRAVVLVAQQPARDDLSLDK